MYVYRLLQEDYQSISVGMHLLHTCVMCRSPYIIHYPYASLCVVQYVQGVI